MKRLFITATGTELGKTFLSAALISQARQAGLSVQALKPIISGFDPAAPAGSDTAELLEALDEAITPDSVAHISPWRFAEPLSPDMAARRESAEIDFEALVAACAPADADLQLIEGVGGAFVPLNRDKLVTDWMAALDIPFILLGGSYLGSISHMLSTLAALDSLGLIPKALVISESPDQPVPVSETVETIGRFTALPITTLPRCAHWSDTPNLLHLLD